MLVRICLNNLNSFIDNFTILYTSRLKTPDSNPLNNSTVQQFALVSVFIIILHMFRGFEPGAFKMVKLSMKRFKCFMKIRVSVLQSGCPECYHWAIQDHTKYKETTLNEDTCYCISGPAHLYPFVCYTILVGGHFPPKINLDFYLAFYINPSSMGSALDGAMYEACLEMSSLPGVPSYFLGAVSLLYLQCYRHNNNTVT